MELWSLVKKNILRAKELRTTKPCFLAWNLIFKGENNFLNKLSIYCIQFIILCYMLQKDKKLKDIVRTGNCIVKKFQKHHEDQLDHEQLVAQVGLRLISRVINMSQLRKEQVLWCSEKLNRIKFLSRKIVHVEPSFLLFPCWFNQFRDILFFVT